ncbi:hypothetical protein Tco_0006316 [Tanacetum coccineum]
MATLESPVSRDEVRNAVWGCGENKSPGPDGFSFEFFRKFWDTVVDFAKAYDSIRWDFLEDVLTAFGFGPKWCSWIRGCLHSGMASVLPQWGQFLVGVSWILSYAWFHVTSSHPFRYSTWLSIIREIHSLKDRGVDLVSHCRIHVGNGLRTNFWKEVWIGDNPLCVLFPRIFALETNKDSSVAVKLSSVTSSLRRPVRGGSESSQLSLLQEYIEGTILVLVARIGLEVEALVDAMEVCARVGCRRCGYKHRAHILIFIPLGKMEEYYGYDGRKLMRWSNGLFHDHFGVDEFVLKRVDA